MKEPRKIAALKVGGDGPHYFYEPHLMNIEMWRPKSNYNIPIFYTLQGTYTVPTTLEECAVVFRSFASLDGPALVNMSNINSFSPGSFGGIAYFKDGSGSTGVNKKNADMWDQIVAMHTAEENHLHVIAEAILEGRGLSEGLFLPEKEILLLDLWEPKSNYKVPRFNTQNGLYSVALTLGSCKEAFPYLFPAHSGSLINLELVERIDKEIFGFKVRYKNTDYSSDVSAAKGKYLKKNFGL
ncbi:hypothetical protein SAMN03159358_1832 [Paenibacillus sp. NFR01]|nr:hypothetical protein SAMN03159358_1832 [Paenibacillus sp. NFR01]